MKPVTVGEPMCRIVSHDWRKPSNFDAFVKSQYPMQSRKERKDKYLKLKYFFLCVTASLRENILFAGLSLFDPTRTVHAMHCLRLSIYETRRHALNASHLLILLTRPICRHLSSVLYHPPSPLRIIIPKPNQVAKKVCNQLDIFCKNRERLIPILPPIRRF